MIDTKLLLGAGVALAGIVTYWISRPSENPLAGKAEVTVVEGKTPKTETRPAPQSTSITKGEPPLTDEGETREKARSRIGQQILPLLNRTGMDGRLFHDRLIGEHRDGPWADKAEGHIQAAYGKLKAISEAGRSVDIQCGSSICEVTGDLEDRPGGKHADAMRAVQDFQLIQTMAALGYEWETTVFGRGADGHEMFVTYFTRSSPKALKMPPRQL